MKYRSLTYIYFMRSIFVSHLIHYSKYLGMTYLNQIVFKIVFFYLGFMAHQDYFEPSQL